MQCFLCRYLSRGAVVIAALAWLVGAVAQAEVSPAGVVVVANSADPISLQIAHYYMEQRGIPARNLIEIETTTKDRVTWDEFVETLYNPLRRRLIDEGWIAGSITNQLDDEGRIAGAIVGHQIDFLVLCRLPSKVFKDEARLAAAKPSDIPKVAAFRLNHASVDSELSLLAVNGVPSIGFVPNPIYSQLKPPSVVLESVVRVARLDAGEFASIKRSIDSAIEGERLGLRGRGYIDMGGPAGDGDRWIEQAGMFLDAVGYPVTWDREQTNFGWADRFDAPAFYFGWWATETSGPISDRNFRFPPGAIAMHIHSYSASALRSPEVRWVGPLIDRGVAATMGNVYEPYLHTTHRPNLFMEGLANGMTTGEAAYYSLPVLSWMSVFVGDPLYRPFQVGLNTQFDQINVKPDALAQYVVLRQMKIMRANKEHDNAFAYGVEAYKRTGGMALAYSLALQYEDRGGRAKAVQLLEPWLGKVDLTVGEWGLAYEMAAFLEKLGETEKALAMYENLMRLAKGNTAALYDYYPAAIEEAHALGETKKANLWQDELTHMRISEQEAKIRKKLEKRK